MKSDMSGRYGVTTYDCQMEFALYLRELFHGVTFKAVNGSEKEPNVFIQDLPIPQSDDDSELSDFPYIIVRFDSWNTPDLDDGDSGKNLRFMLIFGVYDPDPQRTGYLSLMTMSQRIEIALCQKRHIGNFTISSEMDFLIDDEDHHPYYFGALVVTLSAPRVVKEDPFA